MVRLRDPAPGSANHPYVFQFQYGAIKGVVISIIFTVHVTFQFQYGAIKG